MTTTLYRFLDDDRRLLYIGITGSLGRRMGQHAADKTWWTQVATITVEHFDTRAAATASEEAAIRSEAPLHNIRLVAAASPAQDVGLDALIRRTWGESIRCHMERTGLTRKDLRERLADRGLSVSSQTVDNWVMGTSSPRPSARVVLALVLGTPADLLFPLDGIAS